MKGQASLETSILIVCLVAALVAMSVYMKRGIQGRARQSADELGMAYSPGSTSGTTEKTLDSQIQVQVWGELGEVDGKQGKFYKRREDIDREVITEDVDETVH